MPCLQSTAVQLANLKSLNQGMTLYLMDGAGSQAKAGGWACCAEHGLKCGCKLNQAAATTVCLSPSVLFVPHPWVFHPDLICAYHSVCSWQCGDIVGGTRC